MPATSLVFDQFTYIRLATSPNLYSLMSSFGLLVPVLGSQNLMVPSQLPLASLSDILLVLKIIQIIYTLSLRKKMLIRFLYSFFLFMIIKALEQTIEILSNSEEFLIDYQQFTFPKNIVINATESSSNFDKDLTIKNNSSPIQQIFTIKMQTMDKTQPIRLSDHQIYKTGSVYDQPVKIFLLNQNYVMMLIYMEHCRDRYGENKVVGFNITENIGKKYKNQLNCTEIETQIAGGKYYLLISCDYQKNSFVIISVELTTDNGGFITNFKYSNKQYALNDETGKCQAFSLKSMPALVIGNRSNPYPACVFGFCSKSKSGNPTHKTYFFNGTQFLGYIIDTSLSQCLMNSNFIEKNSDGFFTIAGEKIFEYYSNYMNKGPKCVQSNSFKFNYFNFAVSRNFYGEPESYIFLENNRIIIKSSYKRNYQVIPIDQDTFKYTSYSINEHYLLLGMKSQFYNTFRLNIIQLDGLRTRRTDLFNYDDYSPGVQYSIYPTTNYLEKAFYFFMYQNSTNTMSLKSYNGFSVQLMGKNDRLEEQGNKTQKVVLVINDQFDPEREKLTLNIHLREFNDSEIMVIEREKIKVTSLYLKIDLLNITHGPLQRYNRGPYDNSRQIQYVHINYYNQINISEYFTFFRKSNVQKASKLEHLMAIAINNKLRISEPPLKLFYQSLIQTCTLQTHLPSQSFEIECNEDDRIFFKSNFTSDYHIIVLQNDKWFQYNGTYIELCTVASDGGNCSSILEQEIKTMETINKIKLIKFESTTSGNLYIEIFILSDSHLYCGSFNRTSNASLQYSTLFTITGEQIEELYLMNLVDISYDPGYKLYLLLHLQTSGEFKSHIALLFDRPQNENGQRFVGHLIKKFDSGKIENFLAVGNLIITVQLTEDGQGLIQQNRVSENYQFTTTRKYPLYGNTIMILGKHFSDGNFVYIEVESDTDQSKFLVYCPTLISANLLTHILYADEPQIRFLQNIGRSPSGFPHSIGVIDKKLFAISTPNIVIKFKNNEKNEKNGNISLGIIDFNNKLREIQINYTFDSSSEAIYYPNQTVYENINYSTKEVVHQLDEQQIVGPVMSYNLSLSGLQQSCKILQATVYLRDVFTKKKCLLDINPNQYGKILDFVTVQINKSSSLDIIWTANYFLCVQNKKIVLIKPQLFSESCSISNIKADQLLIVCDQGQQSQIYFLQINRSCSQPISVQKPEWLSYRYFNLKYSAPYIVFQVPVRYDYNNYYYLAEFNESTHQISDNPSEIIHNGSLSFNSIDFAIDFDYLYLLEDGLFIYTLEATKPKTNIIKIQLSDIISCLGNTTQNLVYIHPIIGEYIGNSLDNEKGRQVKRYLEIGTESEAFLIDLKIIYPADNQNMSYALKRHRTYHQQKNCKNTVQSISKSWQGNIIKECTLQEQELDIFSNFIPITETGKQKYIQFYRIENNSNFNFDSTIQTEHFPFRMEPITSGNTFQINNQFSQMIVSSFFNFLCYYDLASTISWTFKVKNNESLKDAFQQNNAECNYSVVLYNSRYDSRYNLTVTLLPNEENDPSWKAWLFRPFFIVLGIVFMFRIWKQVKKQKLLRKKINKFSTNIYSNEFEIKVKLNAKRSIDKFLIEDKEIQSQITLR